MIWDAALAGAVLLCAIGIVAIIVREWLDR